jgi:flagellin
MGLRINTNQSALNAQRQLLGTSRSQTQGLERLATGLRINRAADDAAGLAIAERFRSAVRELDQEARNLQYGVNAARTAEGGLSIQQEGVARLQELATQAANGTLTTAQRDAINQEAQQIIEEIDNRGQQTEFNGLNLLNGDAQDVSLGSGGSEELNVNESTADTLGLNSVDLSTQEGASQAIETLETAATRVSQNRAAIGAQERRFTGAIEQRQMAAQNAMEAESRLRDLDIARQTIEQSRDNILQQAGIAALAQSNLQGETAARLLGT